MDKYGHIDNRPLINGELYAKQHSPRISVKSLWSRRVKLSFSRKQYKWQNTAKMRAAGEIC